MNILLVEDSEFHIRFALEQLKGHDVTVAKSFDHAIAQFGGGALGVENLKKFDAVLTDLHLPKGTKKCLGENFDEKALYPFGAMVVLKAMEQRVPMIGLLTDASHHDDAMSYSLDCLRLETFSVGSIKVLAENTCDFLCRESYDVNTMEAFRYDSNLDDSSDGYEKDGVKFLPYDKIYNSGRQIAKPKDYGKLLAKLLEGGEVA